MRTFTALVSPTSAGGRAPAHLEPVAQRLAAQGATVHRVATQNLAHAATEAQAAASNGDTILAVGGDGLIARVAGAVAQADGTLGIVTAGRGNDFARGLNIPDDPAALADLLLNTPPRRVDLIDAGGTVAAGSVYTGIDAAANDLVRRSPRVPDAVVYEYAALRSLASWRAPTYEITVDGQPLTARGYTVVVANCGFYGRGLQIAPGAALDDGHLDVIVLGDFARHRFPGLLRQMRTGAHVRRPEVTVLRGRTVTLTADRPLIAGADGEPLSQLPLEVRVRPAALSVLAPPPSTRA